MTHSAVSGRSTRRDVLRLGGLFGLGLSTAELLRHRAEAAGGGTFGRAKQVILLYLHGGAPQQETFDPKPEGPSAVRGEFGAIATSLPGVRFSEVLPRTAQIAHKIAVVRSLSHNEANHVQASLPANTGHFHAVKSSQDVPPSASDFPPFGAVLDALRPAQQSLPTWVRIGPLMQRSNGTVLHGQLPGFLGERYSSFVVDQSLTTRDVKIDALSPAGDLSTQRLFSRGELRNEFNARRRFLDETAETRTVDAYYRRALGLLSSQATAEAFDLAAEAPAARERYGMTEFGQRCLLARRLAEAGVPMINVSYCHTPSGSWDTHSNNFRGMRESLGPTFDTAFRALVDDLDERGRLDDTLVIATAEFGRTPAINRNAGRDHWPWVYSAVLAGAGIAAGTVYGASDASAAHPTSAPHGPADMAATLYHLLGVPAETLLHDALSRPHPLVVGKPIGGILA
jgi:uncharacterized protein (DUF1501 family)